MEFNLKLADVIIGVKSIFEETKEFCKDYLTQEEPAFFVEISSEDIINERIINARQMALDGVTQADFSDSYIETLALYRKIVGQLLKYNIILFHGCVLAYQGKAYIFTARSGTGKTTHIRLWLEKYPDSHILNGDKPLIMFRENGIFACGTPWMGKENYGVNETLPIGGICALERNAENHIFPLKLSEAFPLLITQTHVPDNSAVSVMKLVREMGNIPLYRLQCNMDPEAAEVSHNGLVLGQMK